MVYDQDGLLRLTDTEIGTIACQFLNSSYADRNTYSDWPLDRRLEGFLRRRELSRLAEDGDAYDLILDRVMAYIGVAAPRRPPTADGADERPASSGCSSLSSSATNWSREHRQGDDFAI
jgi:hypothetical protein